MKQLGCPLVAQLEITKRCNHSCYYCYNYFPHASEDMPVENASRVLGSIADNGLFTVILTGGEPFLNRETLAYTIDKLKARDIDVYVNTNLSQPISKEELERLKKVSLTLVSFPNYKEADFNEITRSQSYFAVLGNLEALSNAGVKIGINQVVTQKNKADIYATADFLLKRFKINLFSATPVIAVRADNFTDQLGREDIAYTAESLLAVEVDKKVNVDMLTCIPPCFFPRKFRSHPIGSHGCAAGRDMIVIGSEGEVRRCTKLGESYGNILVSSIKEIWDKILADRKPGNKICESNCPEDVGCFGGCEVRARLYGEDPLVSLVVDSESGESIPSRVVKGKSYVFPHMRVRNEGNQLLIFNGDSHILGNQHLLNFISFFREEPFSLEDVEKEFTQKGLLLLEHLYQRRILKDAF